MPAERELIASVEPDGHLELFSPRTGMRHRCGPTGTTMWITLQQQNWQTARAAEVLASHWGTDPDTLRCDLDAWVGHFRAAGS
ncbi:hypothetical protein ABZS71_21655 [Streptomyces sp. NPDC005393]|uniref:hypothetical protein n=1 Tax=Streptomyces sp. NPDC005393 TaxID=3157041 RepID=UPI0033A9A8F7